MPNFSNKQVPPPSDWQEFERLCCDLWRKIWNDPNASLNGRQGQSQHGVDIYGTRDNGKSLVGVQCKGKDNFSNRTLTKNEIEVEAEKAKSFHPKLSEFIFATTGAKDANMEELARKITQDHQSKGLFSVHIWGWEDIKLRLENFPDLLDIYYPGLGPVTQGINKKLDALINSKRPSIIESDKTVLSFTNNVSSDPQFNS